MKNVFFSKYRQIGSASRTAIISVVGFGLMMFIAFTLLPKGFSDDLMQIGQGRNIVVLAHDHDSVQSLNLMEFIGELRSEYIGKIVFVVADDNVAKGQAFIQKHQVGSGDLLFFNLNGKRIRVEKGISDLKTLRDALDETF